MADVCPYNYAQLDQALFPSSTLPSENYRNWFAPWLNFQKDDWKMGWGWNRLDDLSRPFAKVYGAVLLLHLGISTEPGYWWSTRMQPELATMIPDVSIKPTVQITGQKVHSFFLYNIRKSNPYLL